jgi:dihydrofolate reductase
MIVSLVVAVAEKNAIGGNNSLLWHLPNDLKFFKNITWGMPIIMGRKTFISIAGKPLPGRVNIVVTREPSLIEETHNLWVVKSLEDAYKRAAETDCKEVFVIGGGEIYEQSISTADKIYLTRVHASFPEATVFFSKIDQDQFRLTHSREMEQDEKHAFGYAFETWERKIKCI